MRVLFLLPPFERLMGYKRFYTHPGLLSLAAVAKSASHDVLVYDADYSFDSGISYNSIEILNHYDEYLSEFQNFSSEVWCEVKEVITDFTPDFVGISVLSVTQDSARKIAKIAKEVNSAIEIIVGGPHATLVPNDFADYADYIIQGEGENIINEVLAHKVDKGIIRAERVNDLDSLPLPAINLLYNVDKYEKRDLSMVMSSRGCYYNCKFCNSYSLWNRVVKRKSVNRFLEEIELLKNKYGVDDFFISDDSFGTDKKWLQEFCSSITKLDVKWRCLDRINHVDKDNISMMRAAGCWNIKYGIESGSQKMLDNVNKSINVEDVYKADSILKELNMNWSAYFMIGFPGETEEDILKTQKMIQYISANDVTLSIFTPYPGTELFKGKISDYKRYSHHSPFNNFTGVISDERFHELVTETLLMTIEKSK